MSVPNLSLAKEMTYAAFQRAPAADTAKSPGESAFRVDKDRDAQSGAAQAAAAAGHADPPAGLSAAEPSKGARKISELLGASKAHDPVKVLEQVRQRLFDSMGDGGGNISMRELISLQLLAQDATRTLELTTKVAEHATSGVKTVLQTQA